MGHLSTSERVSTAAMPNGVTTTHTTTTSSSADDDFKTANGISDLHKRGANGSLKSEQSAAVVQNGFPSAANGKKLSDDNGKDNDYDSDAPAPASAAVVAPKKKGVYEHVYHVDLDEYERNFKGDKVFGIQFEAPLKWDKVIQISLLHIVCVACIIFYPIDKLNLYSVLWSFFMGGVAGFGVTAGAHRFWTHRSYKANVPLRAILMACFSLAGQNTLYDWVRDHRVHHKYSESDADPHNANRGFFFAHVGWLMMLKHPDVMRRGRKIDMSDVLADPVVQFHQKYFIPLKIMLCFVLPTMVPVYFWGESWYLAFITQCIFRYVSSLNFTWSVNSAAHMWGTRPFDKRIQPSENIYVSILAMGEGWHNYHHVFPWDYKAAELGNYTVNFTTMVLDAFQRMGWAWDMKEPSKDLVRRTLEKFGDGTHPSVAHNNGHSHGGHCHLPEVPDPETEEVVDDEAESSSTESSKLDENDNLGKSTKIAT